MRAKVVLLVLALLVLLFAWGTRAGRYQVVTLGGADFLLVDTATSEWWLYSHDAVKSLDLQRRGENHYVFEVKAWDGAIPLYRRISP